MKKLCGMSMVGLVLLVTATPCTGADSLVICVTRVFSRISLIFKRIVNILRSQAGYVGTGDLDSKYRSSAA